MHCPFCYTPVSDVKERQAHANKCAIEFASLTGILWSSKPCCHDLGEAGKCGIPMTRHFTSGRFCSQHLPLFYLQSMAKENANEDNLFGISDSSVVSDDTNI